MSQRMPSRKATPGAKSPCGASSSSLWRSLARMMRASASNSVTSASVLSSTSRSRVRSASSSASRLRSAERSRAKEMTRPPEMSLKLNSIQRPLGMQPQIALQLAREDGGTAGAHRRLLVPVEAEIAAAVEEAEDLREGAAGLVHLRRHAEHLLEAAVGQQHAPLGVEHDDHGIAAVQHLAQHGALGGQLLLVLLQLGDVAPVADDTAAREPHIGELHPAPVGHLAAVALRLAGIDARDALGHQRVDLVFGDRPEIAAPHQVGHAFGEGCGRARRASAARRSAPRAGCWPAARGRLRRRR
jgi:hypothetical protein